MVHKLQAVLRLIAERTGRGDMSIGTAEAWLWMMEHEGLTIQDLQSYMRVIKSTASRHASVLGPGLPGREGCHLITLEESAQDRRFKVFRITAKGKELRDEILRICEV